MIELLQKAKEKRSKKLNKVEIAKAKLSPKEAYERLLEASKKGYDALTPEEKSVFLKYFGLFDKNEFTPKQFMLRVRIPGGRLTPNQAKVLGEVAKEFGNDYIDLTTRMQVELRYIHIEDVPAIFEQLENVGITTYQTGIDNLRNILTDPLDGLAMDNYFESFPILLKMQELFLKKDTWIGSLPRKFNTSITSSITNRNNAYGHDACFVLAMKDGVFGYNLYLGGKVGKIAQNADIFVTPDETVGLFESLIEFYREYGFRDNRNKNRLYFLIEAVGMENFVQALKEFSDKNYAPAGETLCTMEHFENNQGKVQLKDGSFAVHAIVPGGIFSGSAIIEASEIAEDNGGQIRLTPEQNLFITHIKDTGNTLKHPFFIKYKNIDSAYFNNLVACAGKNECSYGVIPNKPDAIEMAEFLTQEVPIENAKVRMYWSACVKGCGLHDWGDIGFVGAKAKVEGKTEFGVDILLGGSFTKLTEAHTILKSIPLRFTKELVKELMIEFKEQRKPKESFESFYFRYLHPFSKGAIGFLMSLNYLLRKKGLEYRFSFAKHKPIGRFEPLEIFYFGNEIYKALTTDKAYLEIYNFQPVGSKKPEHPSKLNKNLPKDIADIVYRMVHPNTNERYQVFSEIQKDIAPLLA